MGSLSCLPYHDNCIELWIEKAKVSFKYNFKVYFIVHFLSTLLFKWKKLRNSSQELIKLSIKIARSTMFMTIASIMTRSSICCGRKIFSNPLAITLFSVPFTSLGILTETSSRNIDYILFSLPKTLESHFDLLSKLGINLLLPKKYQLLFSFSVITAFYLSETNSELKTNLKYFIKLLVN